MPPRAQIVRRHHQRQRAGVKPFMAALEVFEKLQQPVPVPRAEILEDIAIPNVERIMAACRKAVK